MHLNASQILPFGLDLQACLLVHTHPCQACFPVLSSLWLKHLIAWLQQQTGEGLHQAISKKVLVSVSKADLSKAELVHQAFDSL